MPDAAAREPLGVTCDHAGGYEYWCSECEPSARELQEHIAAEQERTRQLEEALLRKRDALRYVAWASFDTQSDAEICDLMRGVARAALDSAEASGA